MSPRSPTPEAIVAADFTRDITFTQADRPLAVATPLGPDAFGGS